MYKKLIFVVSVLFPCAVAAGKEIKVVAPDAGWAPLWISSLWKRPQSPEPAAMYSSTDISSDEKKRTKKDFFSDPLPAPRPGYSARTPRATRKHSASSRVLKRSKAQESLAISDAAHLRKVYQNKEGAWIERKPVHRSIDFLREEVRGSGSSGGSPLPFLARKLTAAEVPAARARMNAESPRNRRARMALQRPQTPLEVRDYFGSEDD